MPKSRNRKNHKKKVQARNLRVDSQRKKAMEQMEALRERVTPQLLNSKLAAEGRSLT